MSYPNPRYVGESGETSGRFRPQSQQADLTYTNGVRVSYLATMLSTSGEFGLYRWDFASTISGPDPHFHRTISESFFVLSGTVRLYDGRQWVDATSGDFLFVPEGGIHAFKNESGAEASMLLLFAPGAPREEYFETLAEWAKGRTMTEEQKSEFFARHDTYWLAS
jgi:mannose-6-phosphate isomerase-like protein (cupin superfamily)